jgi:hypothetical protein
MEEPHTCYREATEEHTGATEEPRRSAEEAAEEQQELKLCSCSAGTLLIENRNTFGVVCLAVCFRALCWHCVGLVLVLCWSCVGLVLVLFWSCFCFVRPPSPLVSRSVVRPPLPSARLTRERPLLARNVRSVVLVFVGLFWPCFGLVLVLFWYCFGIVLDLFWYCFGFSGWRLAAWPAGGRVLSPTPPPLPFPESVHFGSVRCVGLVLVLCWPCFGLVLVLCWPCNGLVLVVFWFCLGICF